MTSEYGKAEGRECDKEVAWDDDGDSKAKPTPKRWWQWNRVLVVLLVATAIVTIASVTVVVTDTQAKRNVVKDKIESVKTCEILRCEGAPSSGDVLVCNSSCVRASHCSFQRIVSTLNGSKVLTSLLVTQAESKVSGAVSKANSLRHIVRWLPSLQKLVVSHSTLDVDTDYAGTDGTLSTSSLRELEVTRCNLTAPSLPAHAFRSLTSLTSLRFTFNKLQKLDSDIFKDVNNLKTLDLSDNELQQLPENLFMPLTSLTTLIIDRNNITHLPNNIFSSLNKASLSLENNSIITIDSNAFTGARLATLSLAHNRLTDHVSPYIHPEEVVHLNVSHNQLRTIFWRDQNQLATLDMTFNNIQNITTDEDLNFPYMPASLDSKLDLRYNNISFIDGDEIFRIQKEANQMKYYGYKVLLDHNPLHCDGSLLPFAKLLQNLKPNENPLDQTEPACATPPELRGKSLRKLPLEELVSPLSSCPSHCSNCKRHPSNNTIDLVCTHLPTLNITDHVQLKLTSGSNLTLVGLSPQVMRLNLAHLNLTEVPKVPNNVNLKSIDLRNNSLVVPPVELLNVTELLLEGNSMTCDCDHLDVLMRLHKSRKNVTDYEKMRCSDGKLVHETLATLCTAMWPYIVVGCLSGLAAVVAMGVMAWWRLRRPIAEWTAALCWKQKRNNRFEYDAFIAFAPEDVDVVLDEIVAKLEPRFKLYVQERDSRPGAPLVKDVAEAVRAARVTVLVHSAELMRCTRGRAAMWAAGDGAHRVVLLELPGAPELPLDFAAPLVGCRRLRYSDRGRFWRSFHYELLRCD